MSVVKSLFRKVTENNAVFCDSAKNSVTWIGMLQKVTLVTILIKPFLTENCRLTAFKL